MAAKAKSQATISFVRKPKIKRPGVHSKTKFSKSYWSSCKSLR